MAVEHERAGRLVVGVLRRREQLADRVEHFLDALARLGADPEALVLANSEDVLDLLGHDVGLHADHIDLVDDTDDVHSRFGGEIGVGDGLGLDALRGIDHQQRPLARGQCPGYFVSEIDVPRRVDQVEHVGLAVVFVLHGHRGGLDRNTSLTLDVHAVEKLILGLSLGDGACHLQHAVGQRALAMIDVGDNTEIAYILDIQVESLKSPRSPPILNPLLATPRGSDEPTQGPLRSSRYDGAVPGVPRTPS